MEIAKTAIIILDFFLIREAVIILKYIFRVASLSADDAMVEIINVKIDPEKSIELKKRRGFYDAYHMSKKNWITIALDGSVSNNDKIGRAHV